MRFGGFVDHEGKHPTRWESLSKSLDKLLFRWESGHLEENIIGVIQDDKLEALLIDPANEKTGMRLRTLAIRLGSDEKDFRTISAKAGLGLKALILATASGMVPEDKASEKRNTRRMAKSGLRPSRVVANLLKKSLPLGYGQC